MSTTEILDNKFGAQTIFALRHTGEICGSNGLPLTPKSIGILGRSQILKTLKHEYLASYLDFIRGKHGTDRQIRLIFTATIRFEINRVFRSVTGL